VERGERWKEVEWKERWKEVEEGGGGGDGVTGVSDAVEQLIALVRDIILTRP